jgi:hypothetical protein
LPNFWQKIGMHKGLIFLVVSLLLASNPLKAQTAPTPLQVAPTPLQVAPTPLQVRLIDYDIYMFLAEIKFFGTVFYRNQISSQGHFNPPNDELSFAPPNVPTTHFGTFHFTEFQSGESFTMDFELDIPDQDANGNGIYDLLEFSQAVSGQVTFGTYISPDNEEGVFQATWNKPADSATGTCKIIYDFMNPDAFNHTFMIFNYTGAWSSAVKENSTVHGPITLVRDGVETATLGGELALSLAQQGQVKLTTTSLTNENGSTFEWAPPTTMDRDGTEFFEGLLVTDGWLYDPVEDYKHWLILIDDKNDHDSDGIPDLIDPPTTIAGAPSIQIIKTENGIRLMITGDVGRAYTLEDAPSLPAAEWLHPTTVTLTASPHIIDLPVPTTATFWRMRFP